jgi:LysM repeat protein
MARWFSHLRTARHGWRSGGFYVVAAVVLFAVIVFLLFRGHSSGPQEAAAGDLRPSAQPVAPELGPITPALQPTASPALVQEPVAYPQSSLSARVPAQPQPALPVQPPVGSADVPNPQAQAVISEALSLLQRQPGEIIEVRNRLNKALEMPLSRQQRERVKSEMAKLAETWLFGPAVLPGDRLCDTYTVRSGDVLDIIGRRLKVPYGVLMKINNIPRPQALQAGRALKVVKGPFHAKVNRSTFTMDLYLQEMYVRSFKVGLGKAGYDTPTGLWRVQAGGKLISPDWTDPDNPGRVYKATDPDYPLGSRWIALEGVSGAALGRTGFAIHGTKEPEQIGTTGSRGCIRMFNGDVILVYDMLVPLYSQVEVFDSED